MMGDGDMKGCEADFVTVVSGLPRSGTSMMMRMLEAGGLPPVVDDARRADADNPLGYYECEAVKALEQDNGWVAGVRGRAVKVIYKLVYALPADVPYRVVFMQRDLDEVLASQAAMMRRDGLDPDEIGRDVLLQLFQTEVLTFRRWVEGRPNVDIFYADYALMVSAPARSARDVAAFLELPLDTAAMAAVVDPALYRNRA